jgi:hypothetical protein
LQTGRPKRILKLENYEDLKRPDVVKVGTYISFLSSKRKEIFLVLALFV